METTPAPVESSGSTGQIVVIIILVIVGIILFVFFLIEFINIPSPLIVPFANNSIVQIKSLTNNLYLRAIDCNEINGCTEAEFLRVCPVGSSCTIVSAIGQINEPGTRWTLCQYTSNNDSGNAKYILYSGTTVMQLIAGILTVVPTADTCQQAKSLLLNCADAQSTSNYFSFILNEKTQNTSNTTSGSYQMVLGCSPEDPLFCSGQGSQDLRVPGCPPFIITSDVDNPKFGCTSAANPTCTLNYLFEIEVVDTANV